MAWPTPDVTLKRYAPHYPTRLNVWRNAVTQNGGNVGLVIVHGGGWAGNSMLNTSTSTSEEWDFANYVLTSGLTGQKWSVVSIDYRMATYDSGVEPSYPSYFPNGWIDVGCAVQFVKDNARLYGTNPTTNPKSYGINPSKIVLFGVSAGAGMALVNSLTRSRPFISMGSWTTKRRFAYKSSSHPQVVVNYIGAIDVRFDEALGVETFRYDLVPNIFGTSTTDGGVELGAISNDQKGAASGLDYLSGSKPLEARPAGVYSVYFSTLPDGKPYDSLHPSEQGPIIHAALQARGIDSEMEIITPGSWKNYTPTPTTSPSYALSGRIVTFAEARMAAA